MSEVDPGIKRSKTTQLISFFGGIVVTTTGLGFSIASDWTAVDLHQPAVILLLSAIILFQMDNKISVALASHKISEQGDGDE